MPSRSRRKASSFPFGAPSPSALTPKERAIIQRYRTPFLVQRFLNSIPYNHEVRKETLRSFREVIRHGTAHCLEAALVAAVILEQHGYPPLLLSFDSADDLGHVALLFRRGKRWGAVARSRDAGLHGRKPIFRTVRHLALSYFDPYVDLTGRLTGYAVADLYDLGSYDWRFSPKNIWKVEHYLLEMSHRPIRSSEARYRRLLGEYRAFKEKFPNRQATYYRNRSQWMEAGVDPKARQLLGIRRSPSR